MFRTLAKIAGVSGIIAVACFALALAIGGPQLRKDGFIFDDSSWDSPDGRGSAETGRVRALANFTGVDVGGGVEASLAVGPAFKVEIEGDHPEQIVTRIDGSLLKIRPRGHHFWWGGRDLPAVYVEMPALDSIRSSSGAQINVAGINSDSLNLVVSSGSQLHAAGKCKMLALKASSGAEIDSSDLACETGRADASSGSSVKVRVSEKFDVDASSGADVRNLGGSKSGEVSLSSGATIQNR